MMAKLIAKNFERFGHAINPQRRRGALPKVVQGGGLRLVHVSPICGPTQKNIHFEGVSDHGDKHDAVFSGLYTLLKRRVDSVDTVPRYCWQCLRE